MISYSFEELTTKNPLLQQGVPKVVSKLKYKPLPTTMKNTTTPKSILPANVLKARAQTIVKAEPEEKLNNDMTAKADTKEIKLDLKWYKNWKIWAGIGGGLTLVGGMIVVLKRSGSLGGFEGAREDRIRLEEKIKKMQEEAAALIEQEAKEDEEEYSESVYKAQLFDRFLNLIEANSDLTSRMYDSGAKSVFIDLNKPEDMIFNVRKSDKTKVCTDANKCSVEHSVHPHFSADQLPKEGAKVEFPAKSGKMYAVYQADDKFLLQAGKGQDIRTLGTYDSLSKAAFVAMKDAGKAPKTIPGGVAFFKLK
jgi:hypothetical protein